MKPAFEFGQEVRVTRNVRNDGTFPGREMGQLLLRRGATGFVRDIGTFLQDEIIYAVDFIDYGYRVGCREQELLDARDPWLPNKYEFRDHVRLTRPVRVGDELVAEVGTEGEILKVLRDRPDGVYYHLHIGDRTFLVAEDLLDGKSDLDERVRQTVAQGIDEEAATRGATLPWNSL